MISSIAGTENAIYALVKQVMNDRSGEIYITKDDYLLYLYSGKFLEHLTIFAYY